MRTKSGLYVVTSSSEVEKARGERPFRCGLCPASFKDLPSYDRHMAVCARSERADQMEAYGPHRNPVLKDTGDIELAAYIKANSKAIIEGRVKL